MANNIGLRGFVRLDGQRRIIPGSLILRKNKPKVGLWMEIVTGQCSVPAVVDPFNITTTTTSTSSTTTTTTTTP